MLGAKVRIKTETAKIHVTFLLPKPISVSKCTFNVKNGEYSIIISKFAAYLLLLAKKLEVVPRIETTV
jgi:hypothetical protein